MEREADQYHPGHAGALTGLGGTQALPLAPTGLKGTRENPPGVPLLLKGGWGDFLWLDCPYHPVNDAVA